MNDDREKDMIELTSAHVAIIFCTFIVCATAIALALILT